MEVSSDNQSTTIAYTPHITLIKEDEYIESDDDVEYESVMVKRYDFATEGVPPNYQSDILILTSGAIRESGEMLFQRLVMWEMWTIYISITILYILFLSSALVGINSTWFNSINKTGVNPYAIGALWVISTFLSYISVFMIWEHVTPGTISKDFVLSIYFLIGAFLTLLWPTIFFQGNDIGISIWIAALIFIYYFWLLIYVWYINVRAAIFIIPLVVLYGYIFYSMVHLASINNITI